MLLTLQTRLVFHWSLVECEMGANNAGVGLFAGFKEWGFYWSSTFWGTYSNGDASHSRSVNTSFDNVGMLLKDGLSVRCLKD